MSVELRSALSDQQDARVAADPWVDELDGLEGEPHPREERISTKAVRNCLGLTIKEVGDGIDKRIAHAMRSLGWEGPKTIRVDGKPQKGYSRPASAPTLFAQEGGYEPVTSIGYKGSNSSGQAPTRLLPLLLL